LLTSDAVRDAEGFEFCNEFIHCIDVSASSGEDGWSVHGDGY
jgi:hypothetical protein